MSVWVLLRGLTRENGHWGAFARQLQAALPDARILTLDLPGNGELHGQPSPTSVTQMVACYRAQLAQQGVTGPLSLLALSLGAMVAVAWADAHPAEVSACVLINGSLRGISPFHHRLRPSAWLPLLSVLICAKARARETTLLRLTSRRAPADVIDHWVSLRQHHPVRPRNALRQLLAAARFRAPPTPPPVPVLILCGARDALVNPRCSQDLAQRWHAPIVRHPDAGHDLPLDDGAWVVVQVREWLCHRMRHPAADEQATFAHGHTVS
ncbi:MAG: alpha/beta hydrolase [Betaproteobacteria bacterium]|nr:MAG: alpha/beta hydrolase [Betaproteobacteria bacterium]